jgi:hypothetical protein
MATIVILEHLMQKDFRQPYLAYALAERWQADGHNVLVHHGTANPPPGDIAILNVDLTVVPPAYVALLDRYPRVINGRTLDISKRSYSTQILARDSDWDGPVIVKTDRNFGGRIDARLRQRTLAAGLTPDIPAGPAMKQYALLKSVAKVPENVWQTEGIIVEKFLPEKDARGFYMRVWLFLGEATRSFRMRADVPIIKSHHIVEREIVAVPDEMRRWRERLGFDYGKFDYVVRDGTPILIDANRTPGAPADYATNPEVAAGMALLARGIDEFL